MKKCEQSVAGNSMPRMEEEIDNNKKSNCKHPPVFLLQLLLHSSSSSPSPLMNGIRVS